jgi:hypothetical protein
MLYAHLGYPVSKHLWIDCPGHPHCHDQSYIVDHRDEDWPMRWHAFPGRFEIRVEVKQVRWKGRWEFRGVMKWEDGVETTVSYISLRLGFELRLTRRHI